MGSAMFEYEESPSMPSHAHAIATRQLYGAMFSYNIDVMHGFYRRFDIFQDLTV